MVNPPSFSTVSSELVPPGISHPNAPAVTPTALAPALRVVQMLRKVIRAIDLDSHRLEHRHGVTAPQLLVLATVRDHTGLGIGDVARLVQLSPSTVVGIIDRLEERVLLERRRDAVDRRRIQLALLPKGRTVLAAVPKPLQAALIARFERLPADDQARMLAALNQLTDLLQANDIDAAPVLAVGPLDPTQPGIP